LKQPEAGAGVFVVNIEDNGEGISKENLEQIFEPFFTTRMGYGTGLGLSITYGIIQKQGGWIQVESELRKGTRFSIFLPLQTVSSKTLP
jgi:two-component system NtrC family sensor kinase